MDKYRGRKVLVTGGLGFIGSTLAIRLVQLGASVTLLDSELAETGANHFNIEPCRQEMRLVIGDVGDAPLIRDLVKDKDFIFNLAGTLSHTDSMKYPLRDLHANCSAHVVLLEACRELNPSARILFAGTRGQYGAPQTTPVNELHPLSAADANGINKTAGEAYHLLYSRHYGLHACSLRLSNTYGPRHQMKHHRQGVLNWFVRRILDGDPILLFGDGSQIRDVHYVDDVVDAILMTLISDNSKGQAYNLGGTPMSLKQVAELLLKLNPSGKIEFKPYPNEFKGVEVGDFIADYSKIRDNIGWQPQTRPEAGFEKTLQYYQENRAHYW
jgi:nucleoside-diphosphate-sugar epimerase